MRRLTSLACRAILGVEEPRVGLLSNGEEKGKGRALERAAYELLEKSWVRFIGNVEGRDIAVDKADVIVTAWYVDLRARKETLLSESLG